MPNYYTTIEAYSSLPNFRLTLTAGARSLLYRKDPPRGGGVLALRASLDPGGVWSIKASETSSQFHSLVRESYRQHLPIDQAGDRLSRSSHANAMGSYTIAKISISLYILSIAFPASFPWTFPGRIYIE